MPRPDIWLCNIKQLPYQPVVKVQIAENIPRGLKPVISYQAFAARLKSCPFKTRLSPRAVMDLSCEVMRGFLKPGLLLCLGAGATGGYPALLGDLVGSGHGQRVGRHVPGDAGSGADVGSVSHRHRRNQGGVAAHEGAFADARHVLVDAVVVAGDDTGADVGPFAHFGIAKVSEVAGLGAFTEFGLLGLDEVAYVGVLANFAAGAQVREGADPGAVGHGAIGKDATLAQEHTVADGAVFNHREGAYVAVCADAGLAQQLHVRFDDRAGRHFHFSIDNASVRPVEGDPRCHQPRNGGGAFSFAVHCVFSVSAGCFGMGIVMSTGYAGPRFNSSRPGLISEPLPTTSTASFSGWMYFFATAFKSARVTLFSAAW